MTAGLREAQAGAARASPTEGRDQRWVSRLTDAVIAGAFFSFIAAFGSGRMPLLVRTVFMVTIAVLARLLGLASFALVRRSPWIAARWWRQGLAAGVLMTPPVALLVMVGLEMLALGRWPLRALSDVAPETLAASLFFCLWAAYARRREAAGSVALVAGRPRFLERLPPKLRGGELWAVEAEDHYLRLHTSKGQDLILMRFSDAIGELAELEGAQAHRSWWVARAAIREVRRADGRATLTLEDGTRIPVSRTHARALRARGWL